MKKGLFPRQFGFFPYVFLIYLAFPIVSLTTETGMKQLIGYAMVVLFFVTYRQLYFTYGKKAYHYWLGIQLAIIFAYCLFYQLNYLFLGFFSANFIGQYRDKRHFRRGLIALVVVEITPLLIQVLRTQRMLTQSELLYFVPFIIIMFASTFGVRSMNRRMQLERELDQANQKIEELVKREERVRIARDLHDTLGHTLSLLTLKSQLVQRLIPADPERARKEAREMELTSRSALKQVRELVTDMRGLMIAEELIQLQQILRAAGITYQFEGGADFSKINPFTQNIISMCLREAVTNVVKHSRASHCRIALLQEFDAVRVFVRDDGMGVGKTDSSGNGMKGMAERLALVEGTVSLTNHNGAVLEMRIPVINKEGAVG
jgi:two-component system sensor histidine kinase DesK